MQGLRPLAELKTGWQDSSVGSESTLHQLAPYIGKMKTTLARALIENYTRPRDIIVDPFCGSGVVPLEALLLGRGVIASDINPYAAVLTLAKMYPISHLDEASDRARYYVQEAKAQALARMYCVDAPIWVRQFFHPQTLAEVKLLADALCQRGEWFLMANLLGILHHQRPGFLSFPSSHLVPYLRDKTFPPIEYPDLYAYRDVEPRLLGKLSRTYKRFCPPARDLPMSFAPADVLDFVPPQPADAAITSPPYMNALDYGRDNRLRLWFIGEDCSADLDGRSPNDPASFSRLMEHTACLLGEHVRPGGLAILVVGDVKRKSRRLSTECLVQSAFEGKGGGWKLIDQISDPVPDIRRSRRGCSATKIEWVMVFAKD